MTDAPRLPDPLDPLVELASAYLDGEVTPDERRRVEADHDLSATVARLRAMAAAVAEPIAGDAAPERRDATVAAALASASTVAVAGSAGARPCRAERHRSPRNLGARAAAVALVVAVAGAVGAALATRDPGGDSQTAADSVTTAEPHTAADSPRPGTMLDAEGGLADFARESEAAAPAAGYAADDPLIEAARSRLDPQAADTGGATRAEGEPKASLGVDPGAVPGAGCAAVGDDPLAGVTGTRAGAPASAFVIDRQGQRRVVVVSPTTCAVLDDAPAP